MKKELCIDTVKAVQIRYSISGGTLHSDRGANIQATVSEQY